MKLRTRLSLTLLAFGVLPLGVTTAILVDLNLDRLATSAREYRMAVAEDAVRTVRTVADRAEDELRAIGAALARPDAPVDERLATAQALLVGARYLESVALYDPDGVHIDTLAAAQAAQRTARPDALDEQTRAAAVEGGVTFDDVSPGADGRAHLPCTVPLFAGADHTLYGFVWAPASLERVNEDLATISRHRFAGDGERVYVLDGGLRFVVHEDQRLRFTDSPQGGIGRDLENPRHFLRTVDAEYAAEYQSDGVPVLGVLVPIPRLGLGVVVEQPRAEVFAAVTRTWQTAVAVGVGFALLAIALGLLLGGRLARPVLAVAAAAERVAAGDLGAQVPVNGRDEVAHLAEAFNRMARDLADQRDQIVRETRARANLSRFMSPEVVDQILSQEKPLELGGQRREITVLFADVVAFTPLAERRVPEEVVGILNELFTVLTEIVFRNGGMVDKFVGDCVMAVWGAPTARDDDAVRAVQAAEEMLRWLEVGNAKWHKELGRNLELGIGINTGTALAGNIGSKKRMEYTVIGDTVNVAARLETMARPGQVLMTKSTRDRVAQEFDCSFLATRTLPGREAPTEIYALAE